MRRPLAVALFLLSAGVAVFGIPSADAQSSGICGRTQHVRDALVAAVNQIDGLTADRCDEVAEAHLGRVAGWLDLSDKGITSLAPGDFAGLGSLEGLGLTGNNLTGLPDGVFHGLGGLLHLSLTSSGLPPLSPGMFTGLDSLQTLFICCSGTVTSPSGAFDGLADTLQALHFASDSVALSSDTFAGLGALRDVRFPHDSYSPLPPGLFRGMTNLETLHLFGRNDAPVPLTLLVERVGSGPLIEGDTARLRVRLAEGAPFDTTVTWTVSGDAPPGAAGSVTIEAGGMVSQEFSITGDNGGDGGAQVTIDLTSPTFHGVAEDIGDNEGNIQGVGFAADSPLAIDFDALLTLALSVDADPDAPGHQRAFDEDDGARQVTVKATVTGGAPSKDLALPLAFGGTAEKNADYEVAGLESITIPTGQTAGETSLVITPLDDNDYERGFETIEIGASHERHGAAAPAQVILNDNDDMPTIYLNVDPGMIVEDDGPVTITVTATLQAGALTEDKTVALSVTASGEAGRVGFEPVDDIQVVVPAGSASASQSFTLTPTDNNVDEADESITISGTIQNAAVLPGTITLADDDHPPASLTLTVDTDPAEPGVQSVVTESGGPVTVTVTVAIDGATTFADAKTVAVTLSGSHGPTAVDFIPVPRFDITIPAEVDTADAAFTITPLDDNVHEDEETIVVAGALDNLTVRADTFTLTNPEDPAPTNATLSVAGVVDEGGSAAVTVTVALTGGAVLPFDLELPLTFGGSATSTDYIVDSRKSITIPAEQVSGMAVLGITPVNDNFDEGDAETIRIGVLHDRYTPAAQAVTITDDDTVTGVTLEVDADTVDEGGAQSVAVTAVLQGATLPNTLRLPLTFGGSATTTEYAVSGDPSITIQPGQNSGTTNLTIHPDDDNIDEGAGETIEIGTVFETFSPTAKVTIVDNDEAAIVLIVSPASLAEDAEPDFITVTAELRDTVTGKDVTTPNDLPLALSFAGSADMGFDYSRSGATTLTIPAGRSFGITTQVKIQPREDTIDETDDEGNDETIEIGVLHDERIVTPAELTISDNDTAVLSFSSNTTSISESYGGAVVSVTATLEGASLPNDLVIPLRFAGSATRYADYTRTNPPDYVVEGPPSITIAAGRAEGTTELTITTVDDSFDETDHEGNDEKISIATSLPRYADAAPAEIIITDNDTAPFTFSVDPSSIGESGGETAVLLTARMRRALSQDLAIPLEIRGDADSNADYSANVPHSITIPAGSDAATTTLAILPLDDDLHEGGETIEIGPASHLSGALPAQITISDDDTAILTLAVDTDPGSEGSQAALSEDAEDPVVVAVTAAFNGGVLAEDLTLPLVFAGSAAQDADYTINGVEEITIPSGHSFATTTLSIILLEDDVDETDDEGNDETIQIGTSHPGYADTDTADLTITDNDVVTVKLTALPTDLAEDAGAANVTMTAELVGGTLPNDLTLPLEFGGSAARNDDYTVGGAAITIAAGSIEGSKVLTITPNDDNLDETDERGKDEAIQIGTSHDRYADTEPALLTITDDDHAVLSLSASPAAVEEGRGGAVTITAALTGAVLPDDLTIPLDRIAGTAVITIDYELQGIRSITIPAGDSAAATVLTIVPADDNLDEGSHETIQFGTKLTLHGEVRPVSIELKDDDTAVLSLQADLDSIAEDGDPAQITVTANLSGAVMQDTLIIPLDTGGEALEGPYGDYALRGAPSITIQAGHSSGAAKNLVVIPRNDSTNEDGGETITISAAHPAYADTPPAEIALTDDDEAPVTLTLDTDPHTEGSQNRLDENGETTTVTVTAVRKSSTPSGELRLPLYFGGSATRSANATERNPADYTLTGAELIVIPDGSVSAQTELSITTVHDDVDEGVRETITISTTHNGRVSAATLILDDDDNVSVTLGVEPGPAAIDEDGSSADISLTATLVGGTLPADLTLPLEFGGNATKGRDYTVSGTLSLVIPAGDTQASRRLAITSNFDRLDEGQAETVTIGLKHDRYASTAPVQAAAITDDDTARLELVITPGEIKESAANPLVTVTANLLDNVVLPTPLTLPLTFGGAASIGADYFVTGAPSVTIMPGRISGRTTDLRIAPVQDDIDEGDGEAITVGAAHEEYDDTPTAGLTLTDDDAAAITLIPMQGALNIPENGGPMLVTVVAALDGGSLTSQHTLPLTFSGSATKDVDYTVSGVKVITIPAGGVCKTRPTITPEDDSPCMTTLTITPLDDPFDEGDAETIEIGIEQPAQHVETHTFQVTISDDDTVEEMIRLRVNPNPITLREAEPHSIAFRLTAELQGGGKLAQDLELPLAFSGSASRGDDYTVTTDDYTVVIPAGSIRGMVELTITPKDDNIDEGHLEVVEIGVSHHLYGAEPVRAALLDDDTAALTLHAGPPTIDEDAGPAPVAITAALTGAFLPDDLSLPLTFSGSASRDSDYTIAGQEGVTIPAGQTSGVALLTITPTDDDIAEGGGETIEIRTSDPAYTDAEPASVTLADDDRALTLTIQGSPDAVSVSDTLAYTLRVINDGSATSTDAVLTTNLPAGVGFIAALNEGMYVPETPDGPATSTPPTAPPPDGPATSTPPTAPPPDGPATSTPPTAPPPDGPATSTPPTAPPPDGPATSTPPTATTTVPTIPPALDVPCRHLSGLGGGTVVCEFGDLGRSIQRAIVIVVQVDVVTPNQPLVTTAEVRDDEGNLGRATQTTPVNPPGPSPPTSEYRDPG